VNGCLPKGRWFESIPGSHFFVVSTNCGVRLDLVSPNPFTRARSHRIIRKAVVDPFEDSQDMPRFKTGQQAGPFS
jgi:hypothetical protein